MSTRADIRRLIWIIIRIIILGHVNGQSLVYVTVVFCFERERIIFRVTCNKEMASILCAKDVKARFIRFSQDVQLADLLHIYAADLGVARVRSQENIIESAQQAFSRRKDAVLIDSEHLVRQVILWDPVTVIESSLRSPANVKC